MDYIIPIATSIGCLAAIIGFVIGIVLYVKALGEQDPLVRKTTHRKAIWSFLGPMLFIFLLITVWGIIKQL